MRPRFRDFSGSARLKSGSTGRKQARIAMKRHAPPIAILLLALTKVAAGQPVADPVVRLKSCSELEPAARMACVEATAERLCEPEPCATSRPAKLGHQRDNVARRLCAANYGGARLAGRIRGRARSSGVQAADPGLPTPFGPTLRHPGHGGRTAVLVVPSRAGSNPRNLVEHSDEEVNRKLGRDIGFDVMVIGPSSRPELDQALREVVQRLPATGWRLVSATRIARCQTRVASLTRHSCNYLLTSYPADHNRLRILHDADVGVYVRRACCSVPIS